MPMPDVDIHPVATGRAKTLVDAHEAEQDLIFWSGWFCPFNQRVWIALEERNIPYQYKEVNPYKKEAHFLERNPLGLVPTIERLSKKSALYESDVLLEYIEDLYPPSKEHPSIFPSDPWDKSWARLNLQHISKKILPAYFRLQQTQDKEAQDAARTDLYTALRTLAERVKGPYFAGEQFTIVDIGIAPFARRFDKGIAIHREFKDEDVSQEWVEYKKAILAHETLLKTTSEDKYYEPLLLRYFRNEAQSEVAKAIRAGKPLP